ncbi:SDR family NAD(P)-dependent oxidoreductase [Ekhidna sp.]|jgi:short-subunit dehydrogenase|uniref:SDR family NAD(P)-dependent oxidoreductase n=1 Tax=Ekhidna sp. TaxID=2608089 RepID=UPI0032F032E7
MTILKVLNSKYPNKTAFITGAASGLGASFARLLAENGWSLHLSDINIASLEALKVTLKEAKEVHTYELDVSDKLSFERTVEAIRKSTSQIDVVINNAGIGDGEFFQNYKPDLWERMIRINLMGVYYGCHYFVPWMIEQSNGTIINIGSAAGFMNAPGMSAYNVSKAGVYALSETLYHELKSKNIHVSVVTPTFFKTNIMSQAQGSQAFVHFAEKQMHHSTTNAEEMALTVLEHAANGKFHIIHPKEARRAYFFKKWFPSLVSRQFEKMLSKFLRK